MPLLRFFPALMLAGCAAAPTGPAFTLHTGDRVGLLVQTADAPLHTHYESDGRSAERTALAYPWDWQLDSAVTATVRQELTQAGFSVVDLESQGLRHEDLSGLVSAAGRQWQASDGPLYAGLREQGVRAVVLVRDARTMVAGDCSAGPCAPVAEGAGFYSSRVNGVTNWRAVAGYQWQVILLDPPGDLASAPPLRETLRAPSVPLLGSARPADPMAPTEAELMSVRDKILAYVEATAEDVVLALGGRRAPARLAGTAVERSSGQ